MPGAKRQMLHWLHWLYWLIFHFFDADPSSGGQSAPVWRQTVQLAGRISRGGTADREQAILVSGCPAQEFTLLGIVTFARLEEAEVFARGFEPGDGGLGVNADGREGVEMEAQNLTAADEVGGLDGIVNPHGEVIAEGQGREGQPARFADEFHVHRERGVAGVIEVALGALESEGKYRGPDFPGP